MWDSIIVGGGTAGLSAALVLGRARRRVLLLDGGPPRNIPAHAAHGFFTRDGTPPLELLRIGREQLTPYESVVLRQTNAVAASSSDGGFDVTLEDGTTEHTRTVLLASGVVDDLPAIPGVEALWGRGIYHCPYCHGWEVRDQRLAVYGQPETILHYVQIVRQWSRDLVICTHGEDRFDADTTEQIQAWGFEVRRTPIARISGTEGALDIVFEDGEILHVQGMFMGPTQHQRSSLPAQLGCTIHSKFGVETIELDAMGQTTVQGVYAAGDAAARRGQSVMFAAADGAMAAMGINTSLSLQDH